MRGWLYRLKRRVKGWSPDKDREFHDRHFAAQEFDPFQASYPGYITIRRFADLASPFLAGCRKVLDIGCGPAEITCELAARFPEISFLGIDHSSAGITRALHNAESRGLDNADFEIADAEKFDPRDGFDLITLFDAFHHLIDPRGFVKRWERFTSGFLLIEPTGDWKGGWKREMDFDWLPFELEKIRIRVSSILKEKTAPTAKQATPPHSDDGAVEQRFTLKDFRRFFPEHKLWIRGTVSGLDRTPPGAGSQGESRKYFGESAYDLFREIDEQLYRTGSDFAAKHWVIFAGRGPDLEERLPAEAKKGIDPGSQVQGPYDIRYLEYAAPKRVASGSEFRVRILYQNRGFRTWACASDEPPDRASYHWWNRKGKTLIQDGERTPLPGPVAPNEKGEVGLKVVAPAEPGFYLLAVDFVREGVAWFSDFGAPCLAIPVRITRK